MSVERLLKARCTCGKPVKEYSICALYLPIELKALYFHEHMALDENGGYLPVGSSALPELYEILFKSTCTCGRVELWNLNKEEVEFLKNNDQGYCISWVYNKEIWEQILSNVKDDRLKGKINDTLGFINSVYSNKGKGNG